MKNKHSVIRRTIIFISATLLVMYLMACGYIWSQQEKFIFMPQRILNDTPADLQLPFENTYIAVKNSLGSSERLHAWYIPAKQDSRDRVLLYLHGSALNIGANIAHARRFRNMGFSVLLLSYRGYGISDGDFPSEEQIYADAKAAWNYLIATKHYDPPSVFIYGHSLGGAVAIQLALSHPDAGGLIVEGSFTSIAEMARLTPQFRILPLDLIINHRFDSISKVGRLKVPVLYIHGTKDETVPVRMTKELFAKTAAPKRLALIVGGGHNNSAAVGGETYLKAVKDFIRFVSGHSVESNQPVGHVFRQRHLTKTIRFFQDDVFTPVVDERVLSTHFAEAVTFFAGVAHRLYSSAA